MRLIATPKVGKLSDACAMKLANIVQAHMLKRIDTGLTPKKDMKYPRPLCSGTAEIKTCFSAWDNNRPPPIGPGG